jgi:hypothetical protein
MQGGETFMLRTVTVLTALLINTVAYADWQYTRWGMTVEQVAAASKGQLRLCNAACDKQVTDGEIARLYGQYRSGEFAFTAFAMFNKTTGKLAYMNLKLDNSSQGNALIGALRAKYGEPATKTSSQLMSMFVWREARDQINIVSIGSGTADGLTTLAYRPRLSDSNKGL